MSSASLLQNVNSCISSMNDMKNIVEKNSEITLNVSRDLLLFRKAAETLTFPTSDFDSHCTELEEAILSYSELSWEIENQKSIYQKLHQECNSSSLHDSKLSEKFQHLSDASSQEKPVHFKNTPLYKKYKREIWSIQNPDLDYESDTLTEQNENVADSNLPDEEISVARSVVSTRCPLTQKDMETPVMSSVCKHSYEKSAILSYIRRKRSNQRCPVAGCPHKITEKSLQPDTAMMERLNRKKIQQRYHQLNTDLDE